jgi:hypothetical protein
MNPNGAVRLLKSAFCLIAAACMITGQTASLSAQAVVILQNLRVPFAADVFVPCANSGAGELVTVAGTLHAILQLSFDAAGGVHIKMHEQPQRVSAVGQTTGATFQARGVTHEQANANPFIFLDTLRLIGQGPAANFTLHQLVHVTVNANGEVTAVTVHASAECRE